MKVASISVLLVAAVLLSSTSSFAENCTESTGRWGFVTTITCLPEKTVISGRNVYYKMPEGKRPSHGWPVVIDFTGSMVGASTIWSGKSGKLSKYRHVKIIRELLNRGYAVIAPSSKLNFGFATYWDTNSDTWVNDKVGDNYVASEDHRFLTNPSGLFAMIDNHSKLNEHSKFAMGISSGGYMADRMGQAYQRYGFKALVVQSAGFATWSGAKKRTDPRDYNLVAHPPTLFLHGKKDKIVPVNLMEDYANYLGSVIGVNNVDVVVEANAGVFAHKWISDADMRIANWFDKYRQ